MSAQFIVDNIIYFDIFSSSFPIHFKSISNAESHLIEDW